MTKTDLIKQKIPLYVIPDIKAGAPRTILQQTQLALEGGAGMIQLRYKEATSLELYNLALEMTKMCNHYKSLMIVNDRIDIALASGAHGVHLGQSDVPIAVARKICPPNLIIGASAHNVQEAQKAISDGADYLGVGAMYPTGSKSNAFVIGPQTLQDIRKTTPIPIVAIGGVTPKNIPALKQSGADGVAVIAAIVASPDPIAVSKEILHLIHSKD